MRSISYWYRYVTSSEMKHLKDLDRGSTANYKRTPALLAELRRLRDVGLIEPIRQKYKFAKLPPDFDLADYVRLTKRGNEYLGRVGTAVTPPRTAATQEQPMYGPLLDQIWVR
jgi:hypothetical protein